VKGRRAEAQFGEDFIQGETKNNRIAIINFGRLTDHSKFYSMLMKKKSIILC
jgi:hypothetical protein